MAVAVAVTRKESAARAVERIRDLREEVAFLVDEIYDREAQLEHPPSPICPGCKRPAPEQRGED